VTKTFVFYVGKKKAITLRSDGRVIRHGGKKKRGQSGS